MRKHWTYLAGLVVMAMIGYLVGATGAPKAFSQADAGQPQQSQAAPAATSAGAATHDITLELARQSMMAALEAAQKNGTKMNIAIVDAGGNLKAFIRMDGAWLGSIDIAIRKARTARYFDMPTGEIGKLSQPGGPLYNIEVSNNGLITFPGGVPIRNAQGAVIGAIGVSGSTVENDHLVAMAGVQALQP